MTQTKHIAAVDRLGESLRALREQLVKHQIYHQIETPDSLRVFMEHHVFAVWDFMSLLKALQRHLTSVAIPWVPQGDPNARRLINEIVLDEESDDDGEGGYISHFELYRAAMDQCGAGTSRIEDFLGRLQRSEPVHVALEHARVPDAARVFVGTTWGIIDSGSAHSIAAAFTFGREDLIPDMFRALVLDLDDRFPSQLRLLRYYLERHIQLDEEHHTPLARQMVTTLCGTDHKRWREAEEAARIALRARIDLWNGMAEQVTHP